LTKMECVIRFAQSHDTFRQAEIEALASLAGVDVEFVLYDKHVSYIQRWTISHFHEKVLTTNSLLSASPNFRTLRQRAK